MDDVVTAYVADSAASAPLPRGLPLSLQAPSRHSVAGTGGRTIPVSSDAPASGDDWEESAAPALEPPRQGEDDGPPLEELEVQMHGDVAAQISSEATRKPRGVPRPAAEEDDESGSSSPLPELDSLVARLPAEVRETLDELFRARFVSVKKLPRRVFSSGARRE